MKKVLKWIAAGFVGLVVLGMVIDGTRSPEEKAALAAKRAEEKTQQAQVAQQAAVKEAEAMPMVTASEIASAYDENTVAADLKFKDKKVKVTGTIDDINTDFTGDPVLILKAGSNPFQQPHFKFDQANLQQIADLKKGTKVSLICTGKGDIAKTPMLDHCSLI